ncbi:DMT family transporter [Mesorhizobium sp. VK25A]|uniref:DMT family transporter n=1 Tax=Mesorhizobium vachelliae TaxID=3072309 RepID=A0ABU5AA52_9HYPH|nr:MULTISPECIES: DMT family transporter [unclassified Mesorhizobium]MDX8533081.1 DMT family transporter [Mesorhizobium sp. VK25D]MDX8545000.1 DMT family transporter [Mesorhizobium sp. VK25A]
MKEASRPDGNVVLVPRAGATEPAEGISAASDDRGRNTSDASKTIRAIAMICLGSLCYTLNDTLTKFLLNHYHITTIIFVRSMFAMPLLFFTGILIGHQRVRWSGKILFYALRGAINLSAAYLYIKGLAYLSVAEATVILYASPFIITASSAIIFKETVGWRTWGAVLVSFIGVLIAIQPGVAAFRPASLFIFASSFLYAANSLTARWIPPGDNLWTVSFFNAAFSALYVAPVAISDRAPFAFDDLLLFVGAAFCSSLGVGLSAVAYRSTAASNLAPFGYFGLIWSLGVTWLIWGMVPGVWTFVGAFIITTSSIFHLRSKRSKRCP